MGVHVHEHCLKMATRDDGTPWWTAFPEPKCEADRIEPAEVLSLLEEHNQNVSLPRDFLLVDARRTDCTGGTLSSSINLPAHSFYLTRRILYDLCKQAGINRVIFYCGKFDSASCASRTRAKSTNQYLLTLSNRPVERSGPQVCRLDARLHPRGWRYSSVAGNDRRYKRLGGSVWGLHDGGL